MNKGFTLVEILIAVLIMGILVTMAVPMYEKTIEKSRVVEARTMLKRLYEAKHRVLDNMEKTTYSTADFGFENLDFAPDCKSSSTANNHVDTCSTKDFRYRLLPNGGDTTHVCARRISGDYNGVQFIYTGEDFINGENFFCWSSNAAHCEVFGMDRLENAAARCD